ncbi:MAG: CopG family transcriptional regulator [Stanieria sp.]|uniref:CopG family transcriptional regulator n=1 Tax=Stanieria cyanosphaera (strain ATCC 29371 / PCC 7437) TaxID=111780 RepID=K9XQI0_STAC7|nr:hypothetical protein [Stanieria cyanosphaera]AFZ34875.1 hypothetical protein Sta7437_1307 [Stanieria cyanosphaera PCC 7437]
METRNITLSIPKDILSEIKLIALKRETSVSGLLTQMLIDLVRQEDLYVRSQKQELHRLEEGLDLGTNGKVNSTRESLHERY